MYGLVEWLAFQTVWLLCVVGAANGYAAFGIAAAIIFVCTVVARRGWEWSDCLAVVVSGAIGLLAETLLIVTGLVKFSSPWPSEQIAPLWLVALWLSFGATLPTMSSWMGEKNYFNAVALGIIGGPLAYWAGLRLGALEILGSEIVFYAAAAVLWGLIVPILMLVRAKLISHQ